MATTIVVNWAVVAICLAAAFFAAAGFVCAVVSGAEQDVDPSWSAALLGVASLVVAIAFAFWAGTFA